MGNLILTKSHKAANPYFANKLGLSIFTGEELSYFIYNYYMLLDDDFFEDRLYDFIERELDMAALSAKLRKWRGHAAFEELLLVILQDIHYYSSKELAEFSEKLKSMSKEGAGNIIREKADYLAMLGHYYEAIELYDGLLAGKNDKAMPEDFFAEVLYNKGVVLARLYSNAEAMEAFSASYRVQENPVTLEKICMLSFMDERVKIPEDLSARLDAEMIGKIRSDYEDIVKAAAFHGKALEVSGAMEMDDIKRPQRLRQLLDEWKSEYIRSQG